MRDAHQSLMATRLRTNDESTEIPSGNGTLRRTLRRPMPQRKMRLGVDVFRIFDSLNWLENMKMPVEEALKTGKIVEGAICYTGDILL